MKNLIFTTNTTINNINLEIRKYENYLSILSINPSNASHKIVKSYQLDTADITPENVIELVVTLEGINEFVENSKSIFSDPACAIVNE